MRGIIMEFEIKVKFKISAILKIASINFNPI